VSPLPALPPVTVAPKSQPSVSVPMHGTYGLPCAMCTVAGPEMARAGSTLPDGADEVEEEAEGLEEESAFAAVGVMTSMPHRPPKLHASCGESPPSQIFSPAGHATCSSCKEYYTI
jgi:hypothetical protein